MNRVSEPPNESIARLTLAEASHAPETKVFISGANDRDITSPVCPWKLVVCCPVSISHRALKSSLRSAWHGGGAWLLTMSCLPNWSQFGSHQENGSMTSSPCVRAVLGWLERCLHVFSMNRSNKCCRGHRKQRNCPTVHRRRSLPKMSVAG